jgi:hypothetical protein
MKHSKYSNSADKKISLGPVFAVNPIFVTKIEVVGCGDDNWWLEVHMIGGKSLTTELESPTAINQLAFDMVAANPKIIVDRFPKDLRSRLTNPDRVLDMAFQPLESNHV